MTYQNQRGKTNYQGPREAAILRSSKEGWLNVSAPYFPDITPKMVEDIKTYIDPSSRKWNPDTKYWEIKETCLGTLISILKKHFDEVTQNLTAEGTSSNAFQVVFEILKSMPNGNLDRVYGALAQAVHPDHGGSNEQMKLLNEAYQEVKK